MYKKKAFLLIEVLMYISISIVLVSISFTMMFSLVNLYKKTLEESKDITSINNCFLDINRLLKMTDVKSIDVYDNKIIMTCKDELNCNGSNEKPIKIIEKIDKKICFRKSGERNNNLLLNEAAEFYVVKKNKVIYLTVVKGGISYKWCI